MSGRMALMSGRMALTGALAATTFALGFTGVREAGAATAQQAIATLNAQRAANGLPAAITENPSLTADCAAHDHYMAVHHTLTHTETTGSPGYTIGGDYAGRNAVLAQGADWNTTDPYEYSPLHLDQLLAPRLLVLGSADTEGFSCTTTFPGWIRPGPAAVTVYTYPGPGATIYPSEIAHELPWTPADLAGIHQPARTGPNLLIFADAPGQAAENNPATLSAATLTGPSGQVALETVDGATALPGGGTLAPYISPGGVIIPLAPLVPGATYHAHVMVAFGGMQTAHDWAFTARGADPRSSLGTRGDSLVFRSSSPVAVRVAFTRAGGARARALTIRPGRSARLRLAPGSWQACGHQAPDANYAGFDGCIALTVAGRPALRLGAPRLRAGQLRFPLHFSAVLRGRRATVSLTALTLRCSRRRCRASRGSTTTTTVLLRHASLSIIVPASGHGVLISLTTPAFQLRDAPWTAAHTSFRYLRG